MLQFLDSLLDRLNEWRKDNGGGFYSALAMLMTCILIWALTGSFVQFAVAVSICAIIYVFFIALIKGVTS